MIPLGGERRCRDELVRWIGVEPGQRIASLCCGTGLTERAILKRWPDVEIVGVDLGRGQLARARRLDSTRRVEYRLGNAARTGLPSGTFDRVVIAFALHEMPRALRLGVLREARRLATPDGRVVAIDHGVPRGRLSRFFRGLWWFFWLPGNPERATSRDLQRHGLANEMGLAGLTVLERRTTRPDWVQGVIGRRGTAGSA